MKQPIKNVVLVHGAFADGSGWKAVADILKNDGYKVSVVQHPETSYADDQKYTKAAIDAMGGPVVLVGHSYGGSVITEAGNHPNVAALVYIAAFALDEGESCASIEQALPQASKAFKSDSNDLWWIEQEHFVADFAADISRDEAEFMAISQVPISTDAFTHKVTNPAWKHKPTWYMVATADRSINPDQERMMAKRANAKTVEVNSSHVAYMSHPKEAAKLIEEAANRCGTNRSSSLMTNTIDLGSHHHNRTRWRVWCLYRTTKGFASSRRGRSAGTVRCQRRHPQDLRRTGRARVYRGRARSILAPGAWSRP